MRNPQIPPTILKELHSVIFGFLTCPEIADCAAEDMDPETLALERRARALVTTEAHPDDIAVDDFTAHVAAAMKAKLAKKRAKGYGGWHDPAQCSVEYLSRLLRKHVEKGDPIDVANFAMMLHQRGSRITPPDAITQPETARIARCLESIDDILRPVAVDPHSWEPYPIDAERINDALREAAALLQATMAPATKETPPHG